MPDARIAFNIIGGEVHFIADTIRAFHEQYPDVRPCFTVTDPEEAKLALRYVPELSQYGDFIMKYAMDMAKVQDIKLWVSTEQYARTPAPVYKCCVFHGQPSKGQTLTPAIDENFNAFFLYGPLHRQAVEEYYQHRYGKMPDDLHLYNVGYAKSDALLNGAWDREAVLSGIGLDPARHTVLYAPAFNEGASLREWGPEIVTRLAALRDCNVIVKLAVDNTHNFTDFRQNGGVNWYEVLAPIAARHPHVHISRELSADPFLAAADTLITDVSSVSYEFLVLGKPVVFIDTPKFFQHTLQMQFPHEDTASWASRPTVNAGRDYGTVITNLDALPGALADALRQGQSDVAAAAMRKKFLYNPGKASLHAAKLLGHLLQDDSLPMPRPRKSAPRARNVGSAFTNAVDQEAAAARAGLSLNDYIESRDEPQKRGHRDRIINAMAERGLLDLEGKTTLEIGPGTGRYTEKVLERRPARYEIYETAEDWVASLRRRFGEVPGMVIHNANGQNLRQTPSASCDLVHAHAVFVYLPFLNTVSYLMEMARVCKIGGHICIDLFYDTDWSLFTARSWLLSGQTFPVVLSRQLLEGIYADLGLSLCGEFTELYGASFSRYVVLRKERVYS